MLVFKFTSPLEEFIFKPAVELYVPPVEPVKVTVAVPVPEQNGVPT